MIRFAAAFVVLCMGCAAWAAGPGAPPKDAAATGAMKDKATWLDMRASELIGKHVVNREGKSLGKVEDFFDGFGRHEDAAALVGDHEVVFLDRHPGHAHGAAGIHLHQAVARLQRGLEADLGLLHRDHRLLDADGRVAELDLLLHLGRLRLRGADLLERGAEAGLEARLRRGLGGRALAHPLGDLRHARAGRGLREVEGLELEVHGSAS